MTASTIAPVPVGVRPPAPGARNGGPGTLAWLLECQAVNARESGDRWFDAEKVATFPRGQYTRPHGPTT